MVRQELKDRIGKLQETPMLDRIENMREVLTTAGDEAQEIRRLPEWAAKEMIDAGTVIIFQTERNLIDAGY